MAGSHRPPLAFPLAFSRISIVRSEQGAVIIVRSPSSDSSVQRDSGRDDKRILQMFFGAFFLLHALSRIGDFSTSKGLSEALPQLILGHLSVPFLGALAIFVCIWRSNARIMLGRSDFVVLAIAGVLLSYPSRHLEGVIIAAVGAMLIFKKDKDLRSIGQLCVGLSWIIVFGPFVMRIIQSWLLPVEASLGYLPLRLLGNYTLVGNAIFSPGDHSIIIYPGCSAFKNTVVTSYIWLCLIKINEPDFKRWHLTGLLMLLTFLVVSNSIRISLMAYSLDYMRFWHDGIGAQLFSIGSIVMIMFLFVFLANANQREKAIR